MTTAEVLRAAKALIDTPEKWGHDGTGDNHCTSTAITHAADDWDTADAARDLIRRVTGIVDKEQRTANLGSVYRWNDDPSTTHADVMAAFDKAIALAEAQA